MSLHVTDFVAAVTNPAKMFLWDVNIPGLPLGHIKVLTAQIPGVSSTDIELFFMGQKILYAGAIEYEHTWACTIVEGETGDVHRVIYSWRQLVGNQLTAGIGSSESYKKDITVRALNSVGVPWLTVILHGAYPKSLDALDLDKSANTEAVKWAITFNYDWWNKV